MYIHLNIPQHTITVEPCVPFLADTLVMVGYPMVTFDVITMCPRPAAVAGTVGAVAGPVDAHDVVTVVTCPAICTGTVCTMRMSAMFAPNILTMTACPPLETMTIPSNTFVIDITPVVDHKVPVSTA